MSDEIEMKVDPSRASALISQLSGVSERVAAVAKGRTVSRPPPGGSIWREAAPLLVAITRHALDTCMHLDAASHNITAANAIEQVRLVAVSKLKPANDILALSQPPTSHLHFGENYSQELSQKAELLPRNIQWHFIGGLQSGKMIFVCVLLVLVNTV
jgi:hypothetical protein